ncbi:hypothetical protein OJJOAM_003196 [Cupriavidus sp. H18C1]
MAKPDRTVIAVGDEIDDVVAVARVDLQLRVASRHFGEHGSDMRGAERQRRGNSQSPAQLTGGKDRFLRYIDFGADPGCIVSKRGPGFRESSPSSRSRKQLDAKFRFKAHQATTDDGLGHAEPKRSRRNAASISHFHKSP